MKKSIGSKISSSLIFGIKSIGSIFYFKKKKSDWISKKKEEIEI